MNLDSENQQSLRVCRNFSGPPDQFWPRYAALLANLVEADKTCILHQGEGEKWQALATFPESGNRFQLPIVLGGELFQEWVEEAREQGFAAREAEPVRQGAALLVNLDTGSSQNCLALFQDPMETAGSFTAQGPTLLTVADVPASYLRNMGLRQAQENIQQSIQALDTLNIINSQTRFYAMAMALCNEVKDRFKCSRVSLGYFKPPYIRVKAISNMDRFEPKMDVVQQLETAMEEAVDQDEDVLYPPPDHATYITRDHEAYAASEGHAHQLSMPLRLGEEIIGAICFEREERTFSDNEIQGFRVLADQCARRVHDLGEADRWWGARLTKSVQTFFGGFLGYTQTWRKVFAILGMVVLLCLIFIQVEYRVEAPFIIRSEQLTHLPAPFQGYIEQVEVKVGDVVAKEQLLLSLDTSELLVQRSNRTAEIQRFASQAENAEAEGRLADLRIAQAQRRQSEAALELIDYQLQRAALRAPFAGVVVEGDLTERLGAPVDKGEILMRISRLEDLYVEMKVKERDIHDIQASTSGKFAFASKPDDRFPFTITRVEPVAVAENQGNVFFTHGQIEAPTETWWRPGMSGIAKINTGRRSLLWIFTHRLVDFLRLHLWW